MRVSSATPTTATQRGCASKVWRTRRPKGLRPGHIFSANDVLTMATDNAPGLSAAVNARPYGTPPPIASR